MLPPFPLASLPLLPLPAPDKPDPRGLLLPLVPPPGLPFALPAQGAPAQGAPAQGALAQGALA